MACGVTTEGVVMTERIAKARRVCLGWDDHGILTVAIDFDYGGSSQGLPGWSLDCPREDDDGGFIGRYGTAVGMEYVSRVMQAFGVREWSEVSGRTVLALIENDLIAGIKPLPTERGRQFLFAECRKPDFLPGAERR